LPPKNTKDALISPNIDLSAFDISLNSAQPARRCFSPEISKASEENSFLSMMLKRPKYTPQ